MYNSNKKIDNLDNYLSNLREKMEPYAFIDILLNDIYNEYNNDKNQNINISIATSLEKCINYIEDSKNLIDNYYNISSHIKKKKDLKHSLDVELFTSQAFSLFELSIPQHERILCLIDEDNIIPYSCLFIKDLSDINDIGHENVSKELSKLNINNRIYSYATIYHINNLEDFISIFINYCFDNNLNIKKCKNCNKYFATINKCNETLCNYIFKNGKSCRQLSYQIKLLNDDATAIYRKNYKKENERKNKNKHNIPNINNRFSNWCKKAKEKTDLFSKEKISKSDFEKWFIDNTDWYVREDFD